MLVTTLPHGNDIEIALSQWTTVSADAATGCAKTGTIQVMAYDPAGTAQGAVNAGPITSRLPGTIPPGSQVPEAEFSEVALNLSALMEAAFGDKCFAFASMWMHSRASRTRQNSNAQDYVTPRPVKVSPCSASGTKFFDLDADGLRDADRAGHPALPDLGRLRQRRRARRGEPFSVTDNKGHDVIDHIRPPSGTYRLREELATPGARRTATPWTCSFPNADTPGGFENGPGGLFHCGWY